MSGVTRYLLPQRGQLTSMTGSPWKSASLSFLYPASAGRIFSTEQPQWKRNFRVSRTFVSWVSVIFSTSSVVRLLSHSRSASGCAASRA